MKRAFDLGDVLSITTGRMVSPRGMEGIYEILNFMTGDNLFTHQLPRAMRECSPYLLQQHPTLADVDASGVNEGNWRAWMAEQVKRHGENLEVETVPAGAHEFKHPMGELADMVGPEKIIVVKAP